MRRRGLPVIVTPIQGGGGRESGRGFRALRYLAVVKYWPGWRWNVLCRLLLAKDFKTRNTDLLGRGLRFRLIFLAVQQKPTCTSRRAGPT